MNVFVESFFSSLIALLKPNVNHLFGLVLVCFLTVAFYRWDLRCYAIYRTGQSCRCFIMCDINETTRPIGLIVTFKSVFNGSGLVLLFVYNLSDLTSAV